MPHSQQKGLQLVPNKSLQKTNGQKYPILTRGFWQKNTCTKSQIKVSNFYFFIFCRPSTKNWPSHWIRFFPQKSQWIILQQKKNFCQNCFFFLFLWEVKDAIKCIIRIQPKQLYYPQNAKFIFYKPSSFKEKTDRRAESFWGKKQTYFFCFFLFFLIFLMFF